MHAASDMPIATGIAGVDMRLEKGAIRCVLDLRPAWQQWGW